MLDKATYDLERAICDKANAFFDAHASTVRGGFRVLEAKHTTHPDYSACSNEMRGRVEQYEVLTNPPERLTAYVSGDGKGITTWIGNGLGTCSLGPGWRVQSYLGHRMYQAYATIAGRRYTGRTFGHGMAINLRRVKSK